jgi:hypothetical protein
LYVFCSGAKFTVFCDSLYLYKNFKAEFYII